MADWGKAKVYRGAYHGVLREDAGENVFAAFSDMLQKAQADGRLLTASLFRYENQLFFYAEGLNVPFVPDGACPALDALLLPWPPALGSMAPRPWAAMQPYFYHAVPTTAAEWQKGRHPARRRGRIALLPPDKWCSYMRHHLNLVDEGLLAGDRWHLISVHENLLFSYLEEPRTNVNLKNIPNAHSAELDVWLAADPESHFARFTPEQQAHPDADHNFVFLPRVAGTQE
ncbi:hypothetical protein [Gemmiger sp.]